MEGLIECKRCGGNACLEQEASGVSTYFCFGCGFTTTAVSTKDSDIVKNAIETAPELYKDLMFVDEKGLVWLPATITLPKSGMVFIDGTGKSQWAWAAAKAVPIPEEDKEKYKPDQTHKMDMKNVKYFGEKDFMDALEEIGFFNQEI